MFLVFFCRNTDDEYALDECDQILEGSLRMSADERGKEAVTRVIVTRADVDLNLIKEDYLRKCGVSLPNKIQEVTNGNYRDFLLTLTARGES